MGQKGYVKTMKFFVNDTCIGCGACEAVAPEIFSIGDDGLSHAVKEDVAESQLAAAQEAKDGCPVGAIEEK